MSRISVIFSNLAQQGLSRFSAQPQPVQNFVAAIAAVALISLFASSMSSARRGRSSHQRSFSLLIVSATILAITAVYLRVSFPKKF